MIEDRSWETGEERCCAWKCAEEEDYKKDISCKEVGNETRREACVRLQMNLMPSFLSWLSASSPPCLLPSSPAALVEQISFSHIFLFTAFVTLFPSVLKTYCPFSNTTCCMERFVLGVQAVQVQFKWNTVHVSMYSLSFQRHKTEAHPRLIALRMTSFYSLLLQVLSLYALANYD